MNLNVTLMLQMVLFIIVVVVVQTLLMRWIWNSMISDLFSIRNITLVEAFKFVLLVTVMGGLGHIELT